MFKRLFDLIICFLLSPFLVIFSCFIGVLVFLYLGRPVFFTQTRVGLNDTHFTIFKFRSMNESKDLSGNLLPDEGRLTNFGKFLRKYSFDEFPQFLNVLKGDMSIVGPRPLLVSYLPLYSPFQRQRHDVRPGITGWAQVNGRNAISWEDKLNLDIWYVYNRSLWLDLKIIILTVKKVVGKKNISADDHVTMPEFKGTQDGK